MALWQSLSRFSASQRAWFVAVAMLPVFAGIHLAAYWLRFDDQFGHREIDTLLATIGYLLALKSAIFARFRIYQGWNRFVSFHDLVVLVQAATIAAFLLAVVDYLLFPGLNVPRSVFLMDWGITIVVIGGLRSLARLVEEGSLIWNSRRNANPVLIVGTNNSGEALLRALRRNPKLSYSVVGFISEGKTPSPTFICGVPVLGTLEQTCRLALQHGVRDVFITAGSLSGQRVRQLVEDAREQDVTVKVLPGLEQLLVGKLDLRPRTVQIEDLLRRDPVRLNLEELHQWIDGHTLMVTGSAGSIGSEICRQLMQFSPRKMVLVDQSETGQFFLERELRELAPGREIHVCVGDVCDALRMNQLFASFRPDIVFHAAAYKHVPLMEANPGEAVKNIVLGSHLLANLADHFAVKSFVMISTDKAVNPSSVMGACKRAAELYVQALAANSRCRFVTVRFGNVLDSAGSVVPIFRDQIAKGGPVTVTHPEMKRFFMTIEEASQLVIQAGAMGQGGEIFVLDMGEPVRIVDLARDMIRLSGLEVQDDIEIRFTGQRPGEKLFEELHVRGEQHIPTDHPKIRVARSPVTDLASMRAAIRILQRIPGRSHAEIFSQLKQMVDPYQDPEQSNESFPAAA
jgi:FlaA1/EpsC-like NDP-sugar epimerase